MDGDTAIATAEVSADHFIGQLFWQVSGLYRFDLRRMGGGWRITSHQLVVSGELGTRDAFAQAAARLAGK